MSNLPAEAFSNTKPQSGTMTMSAKNARVGAADTGAPRGTELTDREMAARMHFVEPSNINSTGKPATVDQLKDLTAAGVPSWYNNYADYPVAYNTDSPGKEYMRIRSAVRAAAARESELQKKSGRDAYVQRTDPITDAEVQYVKSMKDMAELAKFDDYVSRFIDPRKPGNMKWLMEIYPDFVERRLQQAHTDYEFALRNQMIDSWGISTFDDLHFKYLVDQGKISGPSLVRPTKTIDDSYTPGWLSFQNLQSPRNGSMLRLPFASAQHGARPPEAPGSGATNAANMWEVDRAGQPLGRGNTDYELASGMYGVTEADSGPTIDNAGMLRAADGSAFTAATRSR